MSPIIKKDRVRLEAAAPPRRPAAPPEPTPDVRLVRADGVVHALEVRCRCCGETTFVELEYETPGR